jgi:hypothetical protein
MATRPGLSTDDTRSRYGHGVSWGVSPRAEHPNWRRLQEPRCGPYREACHSRKSGGPKVGEVRVFYDVSERVVEILAIVAE